MIGGALLPKKEKFNAINKIDHLLSFSFSQKLPVILQTEATECGLACLAMVSSFYGFETDMNSIRQRFSISSHGATLKQLMGIASELELSSRALRLEPEQLSNLHTPCILHWEMKHFVVLKKVQGSKVIIHDPAIGERSLSLDEVSHLFTGVALELTPTPEFKPGKQIKNLTLKHFASRFLGLKRSLLHVFILSLILQLFALVSPYYMQTVVDDVLLRNDSNLLLVLAIGFTLLLIIDTVISAFRQWLIVKLSSHLNIQMSANIFRHLVRLPSDYFSKRHIGDVVSRFGSLNQVRDLLTNGLIAAILDGLMALITLVAMFFYDVKLTLIVIGITFVYTLVRILLYRPLRLLTEEQIVAGAKENSHFMETVRAIQTVKLFEKETDRQGQWQNHLAKIINKNIQIARWNISYDVINRILFGLENILVIYFAATAVMGNIISVGMLYAFMSYKGRFIGSIDNFISTMIEFKMLGLHLNRLADIVFNPIEKVHKTTDHYSLKFSNIESSIQGKLEVQAISFQYSKTESPIFNDLSFIIHSGETVAIIGHSGSGKTTLMKCLIGLLQPTSGKIFIDEQMLLNVPNYRSQIAAVMQDDQLLTGSILDNITCFDNHINMEKAMFCSQLACIFDEIMKMPMQFNTLVGDMGSSLSGGQKQRIVLARALYREPKILFMDEATSHLDSKNEQQVNEHIKQLGMTRILVAHRQETIAMADRVIDISSLDKR